MNILDEYLKERNIPTNSLEANFIREGADYAIEKACKWIEENLYNPKYQDGTWKETKELFISDFKKSNGGKVITMKQSMTSFKNLHKESLYLQGAKDLLLRLSDMGATPQFYTEKKR